MAGYICSRCDIHRVFAVVVKDPLPGLGTLVTSVQNLEVIVYSTSLMSNDEARD